MSNQFSRALQRFSQRGSRRAFLRVARKNAQRRRGVVTIYVAGGMVLFVGAASIAIDLGHLYSRKAQAQRAADASALAGAYVLSMQSGRDASTAIANADAKAREYAKMRDNGTYEDGVRDTTVQVQPLINDVPVTPGDGQKPNEVRVTVARREALLFARIFGLRDTLVSATSTAAYKTVSEIPIASQDYGKNADARITYTVYGPLAERANGDPISTKFLDANNTVNPLYNPNGYNFTLDIPADYTQKNKTSHVLVDIFDPDCYNRSDSSGNAQLDASSNAVDEIRDGYTGSAHDYTTTTYRIWLDIDGNPNSASAANHVAIATVEYGNEWQTDMQWVTPPGFDIDLSQYASQMRPESKFRIQVMSSDGTSENGFNLRAGPPVPREISDNVPIGLPREAQSPLYKNGRDNTGGYYGYKWNYDENQWHTYMSGAPDSQPVSYKDSAGQTRSLKIVNGTKISAQGSIPMNFNKDLTDASGNSVPAAINIGYVPREAAGQTLDVTKFDTDVGARRVYYTCDQLQGQFEGVLAGNDVSYTDHIALPANYQGGTWTAHYTAESNDTSWWQVSYNGPGIPAGIKLVN